MKRPWMPLNIGEFLQDTAHLSTTEIGAYMLLIMHYWARGGPCKTVDEFRRVTRLGVRQWSQSGDVLRSFFGDDLRHKRLDRDLVQVIERSEAKSANAVEQHRKRKETAGTLQDDCATDLRPKTEKDVVVVEAREREPAKPLVSEETKAAIALGLTFLKAAGFADYSDAPLSWNNLHYRAAIWISNGWPEDMIVAETKLVLQRAAGTPPNSLKYFETIFASRFAEAQRPTPIVNIKQAETRDVVQSSGHHRPHLADAGERLLRRLEQNDSGAGDTRGDGTGPMLQIGGRF